MSPDAQRSDDAQRRAIALLDGLIAGLEPGVRPADVAARAEAALRPAGFDRWYHRPEVRIGPGRGGNQPLAEGDLVRIDVAPATPEAFGDVGVSFRWRRPEDGIVRRAREINQATAAFASRWKVVGELFVFARAWANTRMLTLEGNAVGHICFAPEGWAGTAWPRAAHAATRLRRFQIGMLNPRRLRGTWAVRVVLSDGPDTAWFEEMIYVDEEARLLLGRDGPEAVGQFPALANPPIPLPGLRGERDKK